MTDRWTSHVDLQALDNLGYFCAVPNPVQWALMHALEDSDWLTAFWETNRARLKESYDMLSGRLHDL